MKQSLKIYKKKTGDFSEQILENLEKMVLPVDPDFEKATLLL